MIYRKWRLLLIPLVLTAGCLADGSELPPARPAGLSQMTVKASEITRQNGTSLLRDNMNVKNVSGGKKTYRWLESEIGNNEFRGALENSLKVASMLEKHPGQGRYLLSARIVDVDEPMFGGTTISITTHIKYVVFDKNTEKEIFNRLISAEYSSTPADSHDAIIRTKVANEGSARENIRMLIEQLQKLDDFLGNRAIQ